MIGWDSAPDGGLQFFDVESLASVGPFVAGPVSDLRNPDAAVAQVRNGRVHVWNTDPTTWWEVACNVTGRNLTQSEWEQFIPGDRPYQRTCPQYPAAS